MPQDVCGEQFSWVENKICRFGVGRSDFDAPGLQDQPPLNRPLAAPNSFSSKHHIQLADLQLALIAASTRHFQRSQLFQAPLVLQLGAVGGAAQSKGANLPTYPIGGKDVLLFHRAKRSMTCQVSFVGDPSVMS